MDRKPFVSKAAVLKIEGRMLGKCDEGSDVVTAPWLIVQRKRISPVDGEVETEQGS